jgi:hypothetical protein
MRTYQEAYADYNIARRMVEKDGGITRAEPELVRVMESYRDEATQIAASAARLELNARSRRN